MKKLYTLVLLSIATAITVKAQTFSMPASGLTVSQTITCGTTYTFYDNGGGGGNYTDSYNGTITLCSSDPCQVVRVTFPDLDLKNNDYLYIYDGPNTSSPLLYTIDNVGNASSIGGGTGIVTGSGTCITFRFVSGNSQNDVGWAATVACVTPAPVVANDGCCGAVLLGVNAACVNTAGTSLGATQSMPGCGGGNADDDVWYRFVATAGGIAYITVAPSANYNATFEVFSGNCGALVSMGCVNTGALGVTENLPLSGLVVGNTYYIRVFNNTVGSGSSTFNICVTNTLPCTTGGGTVNVPALPYSVTGQTNCGNGNDFTATNVPNICGSTLYYGGEDNVYIFTPAASGSININVGSSSSWMGIMLYQGCPTSGGTCVSFAQSSAGSQSLGCVNVVAGVTYYLIVDSWPAPTCLTGISVNITAPAGGVPPGTTCANPVNIASLPYSAVSQSTSCMGNDYTNASAGSCASLYESGEDIVYAFTATAGTCYKVEITGASSTSLGYQVYYGCPGVAGTTCVANAGGPVAGTLSGSFTSGAAGTYYIIVDSWSPPSNVSFNISLTALGGAPANDLCANAIALTSGIQASGDNSCSGTEAPAVPGCWTAGTMNTVWFQFTVTTGYIKVRTNPGSLANTQIALYSGTCASPSFVACNNDAAACGSSGTTGSEITMAVPNGTYYIRVDGTNALTGTFSIVAMDGNVPYPPLNGQDCSVPNPICSQVISVSNPGYSGFGNNCDLPSSYCLASAERNVVWYTIPISANGTLSFDIVPNDFNCSLNSATDYDFAVFKSEATCDGSGTDGWCCTEIATSLALPVACNYSALGVTGMGTAGGNAPGSFFAPQANVCPMCGPCGAYNPSPNFDGAYEPSIAVSAGETYIIAVSNFSGSTSGFRIDFRNTPINYAAGGAATSITWSGGDLTTPTAWSDADNWGGCNEPSCLKDCFVAPFLNQPTIVTGATEYAHDVTIQAGATLTIQAGGTLEICGSFYNYGTIVMAPTSTLRFVGSQAIQNFAGSLVGTNALGNVEVNKTAGNVLLINSLDMKGNFTTVNGTSIFNSNQQYIKLAGNFVNNNGNATFTNTGTAGTLEFNGAAAQTYTQGTSQLDLNFVVMNHTSTGVTLLTDMFIKATTGTLTLTLGKINTAAFRVDVQNSTPTAVTIGNTLSYVHGNLWRIILPAGGIYNFPVGSPNWYERAWLSIGANTYTQLRSRYDPWPSGPNTLGLTDCGSTYSLPSENNGYWTITQTGGNTGLYNMTLYSVGATNTTGVGAWTIEKAPVFGGAWGLNGTCVASTATVVNRNGMSGFSVLAVAQSPTPLPVEITSFEGHPEGSVNVLNWATASEINNDHFMIEKSADGVNYEDMERVVGAGNSNTNHYYSATDELPYSTTYYRLRQVDFNGDYVHYGPIVISNDDVSEFAVQNIYPNPAEESFFIEMFSKNIGVADLSVMDSYGRIVYQQTLQLDGLSTFEIASQTWASGVYMVKVINQEKQFQFIGRVVIK